MDLTPKYLGDDLVLLPGLTEDEAERVMSGGTQGNTSPFYSLERWKPNIRTENRMVWVHWGIPPPAWDRNRIRQIVVVMGDMVDVGDDVEAKRRMDKARVLIRTPWPSMIKHVIEVHISGETFKVHVVEECGSMACENHIRGSSYGDSSEEIESVDSLVGDDISDPISVAGADHEHARATEMDQRLCQAQASGRRYWPDYPQVRRGMDVRWITVKIIG